jgi:hypothetical protein
MRRDLFITARFYHMKRFTLYLLAMIFLSCNIKQPDSKTDSFGHQVQSTAPDEDMKQDFSMAASFDTSRTIEELEEETATFYIVVADTSSDYYSLRDQMLHLHRLLDIPIDTIGRSYDPSKNLIALPEDDEDEIYAGDYLPRRFPSHNLSLEYFSFYHEKAREKTIALVAGIYESPSSADSTLIAIKQVNSKAFSIPAEIYTGCIH